MAGPPNVTGGAVRIDEVVREGNTVTVERYLRLIAGAFVLASVLLGYFISPYWYLFTGFAGLNLIQSAFTNWCPMMSILRSLGARGEGLSNTASPRG